MLNHALEPGSRRPEPATAPPPCRFCGLPLADVRRPRDVTALQLRASRTREPHGAVLSASCACLRRLRLVQLEAYVTPDEIFTEYAYFSSYSTSWVQHACIRRDDRAGLSLDDTVWPSSWRATTGICSNTSAVRVSDPRHQAPERAPRSQWSPDVPTLTKFFGTQLVDEVVAAHGHADLVIGNNVLAQVLTLNDFVAASPPCSLGRGGDVQFHTSRLMEGSVRRDLPRALPYFSLERRSGSVRAHGLDVYDVGGALDPRRLASRHLSSRRAGSLPWAR
jgi:hypothetical protein